MKKSKRKKPKFRVGQLVRLDGEALFPVKQVKKTMSGKHEYLEIWSWHAERSLNPLTKRERGQ